MLGLSKPRAISLVELLMLCCAALFFCVHSLPRAWRTLNTDLPNYYTAARLVQDGYDTSRMYEWTWIEREKDHRDIDIRILGLLPITPFSILAVLPLAKLAPLHAKHAWILLNLACLLPIGWLLRRMTGVSYRRIGTVMLLSFPLHRNLLYGQFYIVLLLLLTLACFSYLRGYRAVAGALVAIAAACKVFPLLLLVFFLQRRDWRALASAIVTGIVTIVVSILVFGVNANRTWLAEILPWVTHGEGLDPYAPTASITAILHRLFLSEPNWNPHPWHDSPVIYALLAPALQMLIIAPAILLIRRENRSERQVLLEWSALLTVSLAVSTIPASYNFVLMVLPVIALSSILLQEERYGWLAALIFAYLGIGFPLAVPESAVGLAILLYVPRLPLMLGVLFGTYALQWRGQQRTYLERDWWRYAWASAMALWVVVSTLSTLRLERAEQEEYAYRLPLQAQGFLNASPQSTPGGMSYIAFGIDGYHLVTEGSDGVQVRGKNAVLAEDELSFSRGFGHTLVEQASNHGSSIVDLQNTSFAAVDDAREPMISKDAKSLAFIRDDHGQGRLMLRSAFEASAKEVQLTPRDWNVYEASFDSRGYYAVSVSEGGSLPKILLIEAAHEDTPVVLEGARYPAISPDGRWLAYSHLDHGVWNLWLRERRGGSLRRIADLPCNEIQPSWEQDSKTLLYASDCGRSVWFTAIARRRVLP